MNQYQYTTVDRILSRVNRDLRGVELNETDLIEWAGEALEYLNVPQIQTQYLAILPVENYQAVLPTGFQSVLQVARYHDDYIKEDEIKKCISELSPEEELDSPQKTIIRENPCNPCPECYKPYFDMQWQYTDWRRTNSYHTHFTPVRLANHTLFNSLVCKEKDYQELYSSCKDEYTIIGTEEKIIRLSFKEGVIAFAYLGSATDNETGYPLIPDDIYFTTAVVYYIKWKIAERLDYSGREGYTRLADKSHQHWVQHQVKAKNNAKMPKTIDEYQNLLEQSHNLVPNHRKYYNYFGNLGRTQNLNL